ncbi:MAG: AbrB/MazE/SpoVT family DNA-binding domain-containing protein [Candidatus Woesearchaeota archaeon]
MATRQLMAFGNSSYIVSLPKDWVRKNKLKKGAALLVEERPHEIVFSAGSIGENKKSEITVEAEGKSPMLLKTEITSAYINNYDVINVLGKGISLRTANQILHSLAGMEVIEETSTKIVAKELLDINEVSLPSLVRRVDNIIRSMLGDLLVMKTGLVESVYARDDEVNRLVLIAFRTTRAAAENPALLRMFKISYWDATITKEITGRLERFGDQVKRLSKMVESGALKDAKVMKDFSVLYGKVVKRYSEVMEAYYSKDRQAFYALESESRKLLRECDDFMDRHNKVQYAKMMEYVKHMISAMNGVLRRAMEAE